MLAILERLPEEKQQEFVDNPVDFATLAVSIIRTKLVEQLRNRVTYHKIGESYAMSQWMDEIETWEEHVVRVQHSAYDGVIVDSEVERRFVEELERNEDVRYFVKLPKWFKVPTPIGNYNPDWAIVLKNPNAPDDAPSRIVYIIAETKGTTNLSQLRFESESWKIKFGKLHFENGLSVPFQVAACLADLYQHRTFLPIPEEGVFEGQIV